MYIRNCQPHFSKDHKNIQIRILEGHLLEYFFNGKIVCQYSDIVKNVSFK